MTAKSRRRRTKASLALIGLGAAAVRLWFIFGLRAMEEDSLITLKYSQNLWNNGSLVYNAGERVMGFTSPLWALLMAGLGGPFGFSGARVVITLASLLLYAAAFVLTIRLMDRIGLSPAAQIFAALLLAFHTSLIAESVSGMEMSLFYLLVISSAYLVDSDHRVAAFAVASFGVMTRPEGAIWWAALFTYCLLVNRRRPVRSAIPVSVAVYAPWFVFALAYYGSVVPQSAMSKSGWLFGGSLIEALWRPGDLYRISLLLSGSAMWSVPLVIRLLVVATWFALWGVGLRLAARRGHKLIVLFGSYAATMVFFYYFGRGITFPWYAFVPNIFFVLVVSETVDRAFAWVGERLERAPLGKQRLGRHLVTVLTALAVLVFAGAMGVRVASWIDVRDYEDNVLRATGEYLAACSTQDSTVMLEPLGYVGYFSGRKVMDLAGLVSPEFAPSPEKFQPGWGAEQIEAHRPEWVVLRAYEIPSNRFFASFDRPMFAQPEQMQWLETNYLQENQFGVGDRSLVVMRRRDAPMLCDQSSRA